MRTRPLGRTVAEWVILLLVALVVRIGTTAQFVGLDAPPDRGSNPDQVEYERLAANLAAGEGYCYPDGVPTARRPPGTPLTLYPVYKVFGHSWQWGRVWLATLSALTCLFVAALGSVLFGPRAGFWGGLLLAVYPGHFYYAMHFLSEVPFGFATIVFLGLALLALRHQSVGLATLAGATLGYGILIRPQALLILPIAWTLWFLFKRLRTPGSFRVGFVVSLIGVACVVPWLQRNHAVVGKATVSTIGGYTFWGANNEVINADSGRRGGWMRINTLIDDEHPVEGDEVAREAATWQYGMDFLKENPSEVPGLLLMKCWRMISPFYETNNTLVFWTFFVSWLVIAPFVLAGLILAFRQRPRATTFLCTPLLAALATTLIFYGSTRFRDAICPVLILFAGVAVARIERTIRS